MEFKNRIRNYLFEEEFYLNVFPDKVDVLNYKTIGHFDSEKVLLIGEEKMVVIKGKHLVVSKLMKEEVLIIGTIESIEFR